MASSDNQISRVLSRPWHATSWRRRSNNRSPTKWLRKPTSTATGSCRSWNSITLSRGRPTSWTHSTSDCSFRLAARFNNMLSFVAGRFISKYYQLNTCTSRDLAPKWWPPFTSFPARTSTWKPGRFCLLQARRWTAPFSALAFRASTVSWPLDHASKRALVVNCLFQSTRRWNCNTSRRLTSVGDFVEFFEQQFGGDALKANKIKCEFIE